MKDAIAQLEAAARACDKAAESAAGVPPRARGWTEQMVRGQVVIPRDSAPPAESRPKGGGSGLPADTPPNTGGTIPELFGRLPERREGDPTTGLFVNENNEQEELVSGRDDLEKAALDLCRERGWRPFDRTTHVEIKFAVLMRSRGMKHATLYLNNRPCEKMLWNCTTLLPRFLPAGAKLVIYGPDGYERTFEGKSEAE